MDKTIFLKLYEDLDFSIICDILLYRRDLFIKDRKVSYGYIGYIKYNEDDDCFTFTPTMNVSAVDKFISRFNNTEKLDKGIRIRSLEFVEWFMKNIAYIYCDVKNYYFDNDKPIDEEEESE